MNNAFEYGSYTASDGTVLPYRYYLPKDYETSGKSYPVFLYMHGNGSRGTDNVCHIETKIYNINRAVFESGYECIMIAPHCPPAPCEWTPYKSIGINTYPGSEAYASFLESGQPYPSRYFCAASELLNRVLCDFRVDSSRVYIAGGSNGAGAVWNFLSLYPEVFAAAVPISGSRATEDFVHAVAHRCKDVAIWAFHGDLDNEKGVPVEGTRVMTKAISEIGGNIKYTEVEGGTHSNIWTIAARTDGIVDWIFSQKNDSFVNSLAISSGEKLAVPQNLHWMSREAVWDSVENAGAYKLTLYRNGEEIKVCYTHKNTYKPDDEIFVVGEISFSVTALPQKNKYSRSDNSEASSVYIP